MGLNWRQLKLVIFLLILFSIFPQIISVLSFIYPQSTTLSNNNILVVEKDGIYICDSSFSTILNTLITFSEEDKISTLRKLSTTILTKSSFVILIFSNYKLYIIDTNTGQLLFHSENKLISDEEPDYVSIAYSYTFSQGFYFTIGYIDNNNYLKINYYEFIKNDYSINFYNSISLNSVIIF